MYLNRIYEHARENPDNLAVINSGKEITYGEFARTIEAVRLQLARSSLPREGIIVVLTSNLYHDWVLLLALRALGHTTVSGSTWEVIASLDLQDIAALACFAGQTAAKEAFAKARPDCPIVEVPRRLNVGDKADALPRPIEGGRFGDHILYTSGTTGTYKKLVVEGEILEERVSDMETSVLGQFERGEFYFNYSFGPWTAAGHNMALIAWNKGAAVIFDQRSDWAEHFDDYPVVLTFFVPELLDKLGAKRQLQSANHRRLQVVIGGGFVDAGLAVKVAQDLGCDVFAVYGATEFGSCLEQRVQAPEDAVWLSPIDGRGLEVVDETGRTVSTGDEGIVRVKLAPYEPDEYMDDPEATAKHFRDGFFYPGDMAVQREDGRIRILGRVADVLNLGGQKIAIRPFEDRARKMLQVKTLCAFSLQADDGKEMLVIVIEGDRLPEQVLLKAMARQLPQVSQIRFALINKFPRAENGMMKIKRREVLRLVRGSQSDQVRRPFAAAT